MSKPQLTPAEMMRLDAACAPIIESFRNLKARPWGCYIVGSVMTGPGYRDIDVRLILPDKAFRRLTLNDPSVHRLLNTALSQMVDAAANLRRPVDFQIQSMTEANAVKGTGRNPVGGRWKTPPPFVDVAHQADGP